MSSCRTVLLSEPKVSGARLRLNRAVFDWGRRHAERGFATGNLESSVRWALIAARCADMFGCGQLASPELEALLLRVAAALPCTTLAANAHQGKSRWLHVLTEAYPTGGHTALVWRWIERDPEAVHSVALTFQDRLAVEPLVRGVANSGGWVSAFGEVASLTERAMQLRNLARRWADVVVLHIHMWDVVPLLAFGIAGGPPVLFLNHADHTFWVGASVADRVINVRASGEHFSKAYRGVSRNVEVPIPLPDVAENDLPSLETRRAALRQALGIPAEAPMLLTIGSQFKYEPVGSIDFLVAARRILRQCPSAYLIAVGPRSDSPKWQQAHSDTNGRLMAVGEQRNLAAYHAAADLYIEGFPFGSLTALLEAALSGLACVRAPALCPPPFTSDDTALQTVKTPGSLEDYVTQAVALLSHPDARRRLAHELKHDVMSHHCGEAWHERVALLKRELPDAHRTYPFMHAPRLPQAIEEYWAEFLARRHWHDPLEYAFGQAAENKLKPRPYRMLWWAATASLRRQRGTAPLNPTLVPLLGNLFRTELRTIRESQGWALVTAALRAREHVIPQGSRRRATYDACVRASIGAALGLGRWLKERG